MHLVGFYYKNTGYLLGESQEARNYNVAGKIQSFYSLMLKL